MADPLLSPLRSKFVGLADSERWTLAQNEVFRILPQLCAGQLEPHRELWEAQLMRLRADLRRLASCEKHQLPAQDWTRWNDTAERSPEQVPGRHAMFGSSASDRVLYLAPATTEQGAGTLARLVISTLSWFDTLGPERLPRPDLQSLAQDLNGLEGTSSADDKAWHAQAPTNASPELWFGNAELESFAEHNDALGVSTLAPETIAEQVRLALSTGARAAIR